MSEPQDYTVLPIGTKTAKGEIVECPYCKKNGLLTIINGMKFYNHKIASALIPDEAYEGEYLAGITEESCPQTPEQRKAHEEAQSE